MNSILTSIKKMLGIEEDYEHFDQELIMHINGVFTTLTQLGVGLPAAYSIVDKTNTWDEFIEPVKIEAVKSYVYMRVRLIFDPPIGTVIDSYEKQIKELEWRLNVQVDPTP